MKVKTADLIDAPLDWAVAKAKGFNVEPWFKEKRGWLRDNRFSKDWSRGGPLIEQEAIGIGCLGKSAIYANPWLAARAEDNTEYAGPTPLVSACRCFVASRLGDEIDVPDQLV